MEQNPSVHKLLAKSYLSYYIFSILGLFIDGATAFRIFVPEHYIVAIIFFVLGPLLIAWAQYTSYLFEKRKGIQGQVSFARGPYRFMRNPTQIGLLLLVTGYALATGAVFFFITTIAAYLLSNIFFYKHETVLEQKYGDIYRAYKSHTKKVL